MAETKSTGTALSLSSSPFLLPLSIILASLIISAALLMVSANMATNSQALTGQLVLANNAKQQGSANPASAQVAPQQNPTPPSQPSAQQADFAAIKGAVRYWKGNENAPVTIVEFSDFQCPFCGRFYRDSLGQILKQYVETGKVRFGYLHLAFSSHPYAAPAALAAECAGEQGKFYEMHDKIFENQDVLGTEPYKNWAQELGLNTTQFASCYDTKKYERVVSSDVQLARQSGVTGTPTFFVNGTKIVGAQPFSAFQAAIEAELAG